jgi:hypothetical protein
MNRITTYNQFVARQELGISENLSYHLDNGISICESVFRPGSQAHIDLLVEARKHYNMGSLVLSGVDESLYRNTDIGHLGYYAGEQVLLDVPFEVITLEEAKQPKLNYPKRGGAKKYHVYVKNPQTGNIKKISFGDVHGGLTAKVSNPKARKSFAARHNCAEKKDRTKAGYWACRINRYAHLWGGKTYPGYW